MDRFWRKVSKSNKCWLWAGATNSDGYGSFRYEGRTQGAHRVSWVLLHGDTELYVLHKCDVRACVRPDHLFLGTQKVNMQDALLKGRLKGRATATGDSHGARTKPESVLRGASNGAAALTSAQVATIRSSYPSVTQTDLAEEYGVSQRTISRIVRRETYKWAE